VRRGGSVTLGFKASAALAEEIARAAKAKRQSISSWLRDAAGANLELSTSEPRLTVVNRVASGWSKHQGLIAYYTAAYKRRFDIEPAFHTRSAKAAQWLLGQYKTLDACKVLVDRAFADTWLAPQIKGLWTIQDHCNRLAHGETPRSQWQKSGQHQRPDPNQGIVKSSFPTRHAASTGAGATNAANTPPVNAAATSKDSQRQTVVTNATGFASQANGAATNQKSAAELADETF
jgi:hypothetical protein